MTQPWDFHEPPDWPSQPPSFQRPPPGSYQPRTEGFPPPQAAPPPSNHRVRNIMIVSAGGLVLLLIGVGIGAAGSNKSAATPAPAVTVTAPAAAAAPTVTVTVTATPTTNAQGLATQIRQDGVYVIGTDIPGGTWHTTGGKQCYEATLKSTNTDNIIDNNNFTGPDTVSLAGATAFQITGGCTWNHEG